MIESPPALVMPSQTIPPDFSIDRIGPATPPWPRRNDCSRSRDASGTDAGEIVVCGRRDDHRYREPAAGDRRRTTMDEINDGLSLKIGNATIGSFVDSEGRRRFGLHLPF